MVAFTSKIEFKDYIKLIFKILYRKTSMRLITLGGIGTFIYALINYLGLVQPEDPAATRFLFIGIAIVVVMPAFLYYNHRKGFYKRNGLHQTISFEFDEVSVKSASEVSSFEENYDPSYIVEEFDNWFVIFREKTALYIIPKEALGNQLPAFRTLMEDSGMYLKLQ
ncbi:hypothetical protein [Neptunitalea lumnitzerae]|uniref:YcxB-like protein domain-containing protein n=1 Tax=Neptunitalea lumnitzerae TaxID=2965509 RepID=A0ABQ5MEJ2_9FLAO|nr:hypothetical protein [Neptunitalea sp. Y10]GLB47800.1 hypothetical protein Y10_01680 [Neptunitalea sp. Y10]